VQNKANNKKPQTTHNKREKRQNESKTNPVQFPDLVPLRARKDKVGNE